MTSDDTMTDEFLRHASVTTSQYDDLCRRMAKEILALRAECRRIGATTGERHVDTGEFAGEERERRCVFGEYCSDHGFTHGAEAEELRSKLEALAADAKCTVSVRRLCELLDGVDARDSLAWLEAQAKKEAPDAHGE